MSLENNNKKSQLKESVQQQESRANTINLFKALEKLSDEELDLWLEQKLQLTLEQISTSQTLACQIGNHVMEKRFY